MIIAGSISTDVKQQRNYLKRMKKMESSLEKLGNGSGGNIDNNNSINNN
jgi:hypothetical protein